MPIDEQIARWIARRGAVEIITPQGWLGGKPGDSRYALVHVAYDGAILVIEMEAGISLRLAGPLRVAEEGGFLKIDQFERLEVSGERHYYDEGALTFAAG